ncbi:Uncharacterised protein [Actinobacillus pleuropneumoniae]|nr:Uncharacterised protein [Actinobacillus pleuropneumoniae]
MAQTSYLRETLVFGRNGLRRNDGLTTITYLLGVETMR